MDVFSRIQGKAAEPLASAVLCYLMQESASIREGVLEAINTEIALSRIGGPLTANTRFAAQLEVYIANSGESGVSPLEDKGYLDILIETDTSVVGIENKFWAGFQPRQPNKYVPIVETARKALGLMPGSSSSRGLLVVLAPRSKLREQETVNRIAGASVAGTHCIGVSWESIVSALGRALDRIDHSAASPRISVVTREFISFLQRTLGFPFEYRRYYPFLRQWQEKGTDHQKALLYAIWDLFPGATGHLGRGGEHIGYGFYYRGASTELQQIFGWFGFVLGERLRPSRTGSTEAELMIHLGPSKDRPAVLPDIFPSESFEPCNIPTGWRGSELDRAWIVRFDASWDTKDSWHERLEPLWQPELWKPLDPE